MDWDIVDLMIRPIAPLCLLLACNASAVRPAEGTTRAVEMGSTPDGDAVRPADAPADPSIWIDDASWSAAIRPDVKLGVRLVNGTDSSAWFLIRTRAVSATRPAVEHAPGRARISAVALNEVQRPMEGVRSLELCDGGGCSQAVFLPPGILSYVDLWREAPEKRFTAEVWRLSMLRLDGRPAED